MTSSWKVKGCLFCSRLQPTCIFLYSHLRVQPFNLTLWFVVSCLPMLSNKIIVKLETYTIVPWPNLSPRFKVQAATLGVTLASLNVGKLLHDPGEAWRLPKLIIAQFTENPEDTGFLLYTYLNAINCIYVTSDIPCHYLFSYDSLLKMIMISSKDDENWQNKCCYN